MKITLDLDSTTLLARGRKWPSNSLRSSRPASSGGRSAHTVSIVAPQIRS